METKSEMTVVLVPGLLSDSFVWESVTARLANRVDAVVADLTSQDSLVTMAEEILNSSAGDLRVAGHSMGARVAMEMARQAPDRINRLVLLDTGIHPLKEGETDKREEIVDFAHREGMLALAERWLPGMVHPDRTSDTRLMSGLTSMVLRMDPDIQSYCQIWCLGIFIKRRPDHFA
jgi:pimeloyl-ACP methyl ester carboxylesterase